MADTISNPTMEPLFFSVDPMSLILSQNTDTHNLKLLLNGLNGFERGPNYDEYSRLRESKLVMKRDFHRLLEEEEEEETQRKKQTRFGFSPRRAPPSSSLAQSVPDFSAVMRKENRRPVNFNATPPPPSVSKGRNGGVLMGSGSSTYSSSAAARGSKSASAGEMKIKSKGFMGMARKSYASVEDLKKISVAAASAINNGGGGGGGGRKAGGGGGDRTIFGYRQIY
ncbi:unnamed protein product [Cochlearia groenlandica]